MTLAERATKIREILESATPLLLEGYSASPGADLTREKLLGTEQKSSPRDLVTIYDKKVEAFLTEALRKNFPGENILGEEEQAALGKKPAELLKDVQGTWVIDPIDGTTNFSRAYPFFCSTICWLERDSGGIFQPKAGAVWDPVHKEMFWAFEGGGAWLGQVPMRVSKVKDPVHSLLCTGFASLRAFKDDQTFALFKELTQETLGVRRDGSAALDLAFVAAGRTDAYWEWGLAPWDIAAGILLVREAGGLCTLHNSKPLDLLDGEILAANPTIYPWILKKIQTRPNQ